MALGFVTEPVISVLSSGIQCDRLYLLYNDNERIIESKENVKAAYKAAGFSDDDLIFIETDPFDYTKVLNSVMRMISAERETSECKVKFFINITLGTSIITAALCTASYMSGAQMYYRMDSRKFPAGTPADKLFMMIPTAKIPDLEKMTTKRRNFLKFVNTHQPVYISELSEFGSKQNINQLINYFVKQDLILKEPVGKRITLSTTELGTMVSEWIL